MLTDAEFDEARRRMMSAWSKGDLGDASAALDIVLSEGSAEMKGECLFYHGMISEHQGALSEARQRWSDAIQYVREGSFLRFQLELSLGRSWEREAHFEDALAWFRKALETCCQGDEFAGTSALTGYLRLKEGKIEPLDEPIIACVAEKSWRVLELAGTPDPTDWTTTAAKLAEEFESRAQNIVDHSEQ